MCAWRASGKPKEDHNFGSILTPDFTTEARGAGSDESVKCHLLPGIEGSGHGVKSAGCVAASDSADAGGDWNFSGV